MGLYQSELNKQIHLRNKQKQEWDLMKKKLQISEEKKQTELSKKQMLLEKEQEMEDQQEVQETDVSKTLSAAMVQSARDHETSHTLQRAVDLLHNQNGNFV